MTTPTVAKAVRQNVPISEHYGRNARKLMRSVKLASKPAAMDYSHGNKCGPPTKLPELGATENYVGDVKLDCSAHASRARRSETLKLHGSGDSPR